MSRVTSIAVVVLSIIFTSAVSAKQKKTDTAGSEKVEYLYMEALKLDNKGELDAAFDLLRRATAIDSTNAEVNYWLSMYYYHLGEEKEAARCAVAAADANSDNYWYNIGAANMLLNIGDNKNAIRIYNRMLYNDPYDESLHQYLAEAYLADEDYDSALACYDNIERLTGDMYYATMMKINILDRLERKDDILKELKRLSEANPDNIEYKTMLSSGYLEVDSIEQSMAVIREIEAMNPENCLLPMAKAEYYRVTKNEDSLQVALFDAFSCPDLELNTKLVMLKNFIYILLQKDKDVSSFQKADQLFSSLIEAYPRSSDIRDFYTEVLLMQEKYPEAEEQIRISLDLQPDNQEMWKKLIGVLFNQNKSDAMNNAIDESLEYFGEDSLYLSLAGSYYFYAEQDGKALTTLHKAASKMQQNTEVLSGIYAQIGDIYYKQNNVDSAFCYYEKAIEYNPKNLGALNNYSYYIAISGGDLKKAEKMSAITIAEEPANATYLDTYGWIFFKQGNYTLAELYTKMALDNSGDVVPEILDHYGDILYKQGKTVEAVRYWKQAEEAGLDSEILKKKIETQQYIEEQ